ARGRRHRSRSRRVAEASPRRWTCLRRCLRSGRRATWGKVGQPEALVGAAFASLEVLEDGLERDVLLLGGLFLGRDLVLGLHVERGLLRSGRHALDRRLQDLLLALVGALLG